MNCGTALESVDSEKDNRSACKNYSKKKIKVAKSNIQELEAAKKVAQETVYRVNK